MPVDSSARVWTSGLMNIRPVQTSRAYLTTIKPHRDGTEQRRAHRNKPRRFLDFEVVQGRADNDAFTKIMRELHGYSDVLWAVPDWGRRQLSTTVLAASGNTLDVANVDTRYMVVGETVILADNGRYERRDIQGIAGSTLTFVENNGADPWPIGTRVYAALPGYLPPDIPFQMINRDRIAIGVRFIIDPTNDFYVEPPAAATTFNGREVFNRFPIRLDPLPAGINSGVSNVDYGYGPVARRRRKEFITENRVLTIVGCDAARTQEIEDVFIRARGRRGTFYMPTWENDFRILSTASSGTSNLVVYGDDIEPAYDGSIVHNAIAIQFTDNTWEFNIVSGFITGVDQTTLVMRNNWSRDIDPDEVRRISWMPIWRFSNDQLNTVWNMKSGHGVVEPAVQTLPNPDVSQGTGAVNLPLPVLSGNANQIMQASGGITTTVPILNSEADIVWTADGAIDTPVPTLSGQARQIMSASGAIDAPLPQLEGFGFMFTADIGGAGWIDLPMPTLSGDANQIMQASGAIDAPVPQLSGVGLIPDRLLLEGDAQDNGDNLLLEGDAQSGTDVLQLEGDANG